MYDKSLAKIGGRGLVGSRYFFRGSPSKAGHECSRSVDASRAALRRPEVREQIELFWSQAPPVPSELSVDEHAELLAKAARVAWRRAAPRVQTAPQTDWMDEEAWQAVRAHAVARRAHQKASRFLSEHGSNVFYAVEVCSEARQ